MSIITARRPSNRISMMAARLDTTFTEALLYAATISSVDVAPPVDSIMQLLARRCEHLSPTSRLWLDGTEAVRRRDPSALRDLRDLARRYLDLFPRFAAAWRCCPFTMCARPTPCSTRWIRMATGCESRSGTGRAS